MIESATEFRKNGFNDEDAAQLGQIAAMYQNVSDETISAGESASFIISQMIAFGIEAKNAESIIDSINEVANNYAVSSGQLATSLGVVASSSATMGNSMQETLGLMTAITEITKNASKSARGLNAIFANLAQVLDENSSNGAKITQIFQNLGLSMYNANGQLKSGYELLQELASVWDTLSENQQKYIGTTIANTTQLNNFLALMSNFDHAAEATETALNSAGSAARENEKYMEGVAAKTQALKESFEKLSNVVVGSDLVKKILSLANGFLKLLSTPVGSFVTQVVLLTGALGGLAALIGSENFVTKIGGQFVNGLKLLKGALTGATEATFTFSTALNVAFPIITVVATALMGLSKVIDYFTVSVEEQQEKVESLSGSLKNLQGEYEALKNQTSLTEDEERRLKVLEAQITANERILEQEAEKLYLRQYGEDSAPNQNLFGKDFWTLPGNELGLTGLERITKHIGDVEKLRESLELIENEIISLDKTSATYAGEVQALTTRKEQLEDQILELDKKLKTETDDLIHLTGSMSNVPPEVQVVIDAYIAYIGVTNDVTEGTEKSTEIVRDSIDIFEQLKPTIKQLSSSLGVLQDSYDVLSDIAKTYNSTGAITAEQLGKLIALGDDYVDMLSMENGQLVVNKEELYDKSVQLRQEAIEQAKATAATELYKIAVYGVGEAAEKAANKANNASSKYNDYIFALDQVTTGALSAAAAVGFLEAETGGGLEVFGDEQKKAMEDVMSNLTNFIGYINTTGVKFKGSLPSKSGGAGGKGRSSKQTDPIAKQNKLFKEQVEILEDRLYLQKKNGATDQEQIVMIREIQKTIHEQANWYRSKGLDENSKYLRELKKQWWKYQDDIVNLQHNMFDERLQVSEDYISQKNELDDWGSDTEVKAWKRVVDWMDEWYSKGLIDYKYYLSKRGEAVKKAAKAEKEAWKHAREAAEKWTQDNIDTFEDLFGAVANQAQKEIDALEQQKQDIEEEYQNQIDAIEKANEELERQIELERALDNIARARQQKVYVYKDGRFQYVENVDKVSEAQAELERLKREEQKRKDIEMLEAQKKAELDLIDQSIKHWQKYVHDYGDFVDKYLEEQKRKQLEDQFNVQLEGKNWELSLKNLSDYVAQYTALMKQLNALQGMKFPGAMGGMLGGGLVGSGIDWSDAWWQVENSPNLSQADKDAWQDWIHSQKEQEMAGSGATFNPGTGKWEGGYRPPVGGGGGSSNDWGHTTDWSEKWWEAETNPFLSPEEKKELQDWYHEQKEQEMSGSGNKFDPSTGKWERHANGTLSAPGGISLVGEQGPELRLLNSGDGVLPADVTKNLWSWGATTPSELMGNVVSGLKAIGQTIGITIQNFNPNLPSVTDGEGFANYMKNNFWRETLQFAKT